jgi:hypothetical protein
MESPMSELKPTDEPSPHDLEWARTFIAAILVPGSDQAEAGISILAKLFSEKRREARGL